MPLANCPKTSANCKSFGLKCLKEPKGVKYANSIPYQEFGCFENP